MDNRLASLQTAPGSVGEVALSVVIVNWNTCALLRCCVQTVEWAAIPVRRDVETIVIDNCSTDGSAAMIRSEFPGVRLVENEENVGFAQANNQGLRLARGEYLLLLNPDTEVSPESFNLLLQFMEANPRVGGVGPKLVNPDGSLQTSCYPSPTLFREWWRLFHLDRLRRLGVYAMGEWDLSCPREVDVIQGACLMLRREALEEVGLLDEGYFMYTEEVDLCYRMKHAGWELNWFPSAVVMHHGGSSTSQMPRRMFLELYSSKIRFFRKHRGALAAVVYKLILVLASASRLIVGAVAWLSKDYRSHRRPSLASNYLRLLISLPGL